MPVLREMALNLLVALLAGVALPWPVPADPVTRLVGGFGLVLPFQAGYAVAGLAGRRAGPWQHLLLAAGVWGLTLPAMGREPAPGLGPGVPLAVPALAVGLVLALVAAGVAAARHGRDRRGEVLRAAAATLWLYAAAFPGTRALLLPLVPAGQTAAAAMVLAGVGGTYAVLRLLWALAWPLPVDPWFRGK